MAGSFDIKFTGDLSDLQRSLDAFAKDTTKKTKEVEKSFVSLETVVGTLAATFAAFKLAGFLKDSIQAASEQEDAINKLNIALANSGQFTEEASKDFQEFAAAIQETTKFSDDAIIQNAALIESLGRLDEEGLKEATRAALELSSAFGIDLETASRAIGKSVEGNVGALKKFGLEVKQGANDAETFANAINLINSRFGGTAEAQVNSFSGAVARLGNVYNELEEAVGNNIIKNQAIIALINLASKAFISLAEIINGEGGAIGLILKDLADLFLVSLSKGINLAAFAMTALVEAGYQLINVFRATVISIGDSIAVVSELVVGQNELTDAIRGTNQEILKSKEAQRESLDNFRLGLEQQQASIDQAIANTQTQINADNELTQAKIQNRNVLDDDQAAREEADAERAAQKLEKEITSLQERQDLLKQFGDANAAQEIAANQAKLDALKAQEDANSSRILKLKKDEAKKLNDLRKEQLANTKSSLEFISSLQRESSKELFAIGKASAIAVAIIDGIAAVQKALNTPFPLNIILPPIVGAAAAANVARIASAQPPALAGGIDSVPGIGTQDNFPAILAPGERVVPSETNRDLTAFLQNSEGLGEKLDVIAEILNRIQFATVVNIGDRNIATVVRDAFSDGRVLVP